MLSLLNSNHGDQKEIIIKNQNNNSSKNITISKINSRYNKKINQFLEFDLLNKNKFKSLLKNQKILFNQTNQEIHQNILNKDLIKLQKNIKKEWKKIKAAEINRLELLK
jgi:hypothetical protein